MTRPWALINSPRQPISELSSKPSRKLQPSRRVRLWRGLYLGAWLVCFGAISVGCNPGGNVVYVTATVPRNTDLPNDEPTLPNPFKPTPTPSGPTPTPRVVTPNPTFPVTPTTYTYKVAAGDTLSTIADLYGTTIEQITQLNPAIDVNNLTVDQQLIMPGRPTQETSNLKLIPDSELVNSPSARGFDVAAYVKFQPGFLRVYSEDVLGRRMNGAEIIKFTALSTGIHPRLLLALLEYRGGWITNAVVAGNQLNYPMGFIEPNRQGLFRQLFHAADLLNGGYYGYKHRGDTYLLFPDKSRLGYAPALNAGTVAVQYFLGQTATSRAAWRADVDRGGFFTTYMALFGDPFQNAVEPLVPSDLQQPTFQLPFKAGETWYLTAGPHGGWDPVGSGWSSIDFAPPTPSDELIAQQGYCYISPAFVTAVVGGMVVRAGDGAVVIDLDRDGDERTGWTVIYLHIADDDMIKAGTLVNAGDPIGKASCAGFYLNTSATHIHVGRRYNGEWIPADCWACPPGIAAPPFVMGGWRVRGYPLQAYQGFLERGTAVVRAEQGRDDPANHITADP